MATADAQRISRLSRYFESVIRGEANITTSRHSLLFIEALCAQPDAAACAHKLTASPAALSSVQTSVRVDLSLEFLSDSAVSLLTYLQTSNIRSIAAGHVLKSILQCIVQPPFFWNAFSSAMQSGQLPPAGIQSYAWLLCELLLVLPSEEAQAYYFYAHDPLVMNKILNATDAETRSIGHRIKHVVSTQTSLASSNIEDGPGGRHDNDFPNIRRISVLPTGDELICKNPPFLRVANDLGHNIPDTLLPVTHLDNQFRLLREDMIGEIRSEILAVVENQTSRHHGLILDGVRITGVSCVNLTDLQDRKFPPYKWQRWGIKLQSTRPLPSLSSKSENARVKYLEDYHGEGYKILRQDSLACLLVGGEVAAFGTIERNVNLLAQDLATVVVHLHDDMIIRALNRLNDYRPIKLVQVDTAVFAFEPILRRLQSMKEVPLAEELLLWGDESMVRLPPQAPSELISLLQRRNSQQIQDVLGIKENIVLDKNQLASLLAGLSQRVSLIQGPPGTGKSFIGALIVKALVSRTSQKIMVVCFTNHALDQFLEDLMDIGISSDKMVRLGGKSTDRTKPLLLKNQLSTTKFTSREYARIDAARLELSRIKYQLEKIFVLYSSPPRNSDVMEYLEFAVESLPFFEAFHFAQDSEGMQRVGRKGKAAGAFYLFNRWKSGSTSAGIVQAPGCDSVWQIPAMQRPQILRQWYRDISRGHVEEIQRLGSAYSRTLEGIRELYNDKDARILQSKRIIGCTTTAAAMYSELLKAASAEVLVVEEAGEILEAHILTAIGPETQQLVLIGDHLQLRPKINNYDLSVEKGDGYDLNRSLFERLVLQGFPCATLSEQHRMRPEISSLIRHLTYPELVDGAGTKGRPDIRGLCGNVIFVDHRQSETTLKDMKQRDKQKGSSKQNEFESLMVLKCVKYLAQQGYGSEDIVVLTPYLGQLRMLQDTLRTENDPVLNDLDKHDLIQAGLLLPDVAQNADKRSVHLSSIDNYQGEEKKIVIVSMTRSNPDHDIGFMSQPERLNVLLSRARDGLIMIGNLENFVNARKGKEIWQKFANYIQNDQRSYVHTGLPVKCQTHPDRKALLSKPEDFDKMCPDGGCGELCGVLLSCGIHKCPQHCHILSDHSKMRCDELLSTQCSKGHTEKWLCHRGAPYSCQTCETEDKVRKQKAENAFRLQQSREAAAQAHLRDVLELDTQIEAARQQLADGRVLKEREAVMEQKRMDLRNAIAAAAPRSATKPYEGVNQSMSKEDTAPGTQESQSRDQMPQPSGKDTLPATAEPNIDHSDTEAPASTSSEPRMEWDRQKRVENADNEAIDGIMDLVGLEEVCAQVLRLKAKIETSQRQNLDMKGERFGVVFLGNPGTGKTTVARLYAKFLVSMNVLPGSEFRETTGAKLANEGVAGAKKLLEEVVNAGGGAIFIDEAYQLTSAQNYGGGAVLDFLLAEIENLTGKVVFMFAGYAKNMEAFFAHNPGLPSRVPYSLHFADYTDAELLLMLGKLFHRKYGGKARVEGGLTGLYARIVCRRLGRGRGREGFGNLRDLQTIFSRICERQADRISRERRSGTLPDDYSFLCADLIGPDPSTAIKKSPSWNKLQKLIGIQDVKKSVVVLFELIKTNYQRELKELQPVQMSLNKVFLGAPGTGKTSVAKLYGRLLADLGLLSNGEGSHLGGSEQNTKNILQASIGKVLIIDEAYMLGPGDSTSGASEPYRTAVIDTLVAEIQSVPGEDRCVLLLGYDLQMITMFQNVNPGLSRRFPLNDAFHFHDFDDAELQEILKLKLSDQDIMATPQAISVAIDVLARARNGLNFGNGGAVENLLSEAKNNYQHRALSENAALLSGSIELQPQDFDPNFNRASDAETNLHKLFEDVVGCEELVAQLDEYQKVAQGAKAKGLDPREHVPTNYIFKGPPGTGKTTTARKIGQVYYDLGFLSQIEVVECSASDLIGEYVGHTGPKTRKQLERGLGRVLFIDEAYRLGEGLFATEAVNELVDLLTKSEFMGKLVVILAGYEDDMNRLMSVNPGLTSRFPEIVRFQSLSPENCIKLLLKRMAQVSMTIPALEQTESEDYKMIHGLFAELSVLKSWGNGRDVQTLAKKMMRHVFVADTASTSSTGPTAQQAIKCLQDELNERKTRELIPLLSSHSMNDPPARTFSRQPQPAADQVIAPPQLNVAEKPQEPTAAAALEQVLSSDGTARDSGVSDAIWSQLQADAAAHTLYLRTQEQALRSLTSTYNDARNIAYRLQKAVEKQEKQEPTPEDSPEWKRELEAARMKVVEAQKVRDEEMRRLEEMRKRVQEEKRKEAVAQEKLRAMGVCVAGYRWIRSAGGYRCAGGSHFVGMEALGVE